MSKNVGRYLGDFRLYVRTIARYSDLVDFPVITKKKKKVHTFAERVWRYFAIFCGKFATCPGKHLATLFRTRTRVVAAMMGAADIRGENLEYLRIPYF